MSNFAIETMDRSSRIENVKKKCNEKSKEMNRNTWKWGRAPSATPPTAPTQEPMVIRSFRRSDLARKVYPNLSMRDAGFRVVEDIHSNPPLREQMYRLGYRRNRKDYTPAQIRVLMNFYRENPH